MKKLFALLLTLIMTLSLAACGDNGKTPSSKTDNPDVSQNSGQTNNESWPSISYLKDTDQYAGDGEITQIKEGF